MRCLQVKTFVLVSYKQCIKTMESSPSVPSAELNLVYQKCNEATACSRRIHSLIQTRCDEARTKLNKNTPVVSAASSSVSCSTQTPSWSRPLHTQYVSALKLLILLTYCHFVRRYYVIDTTELTTSKESHRVSVLIDHISCRHTEFTDIILHKITWSYVEL